MRCFRDQRGRQIIGTIVARQRLQALPAVRTAILGRLVAVDDETVAERHDRITTHLAGDERCVHVALVGRIQPLPRQGDLSINSAAGFACFAFAWRETDMAVQRGFDDAGQIMAIAHILQREQTVTRRLRQCRLPPSVGRLRLVIESGLAVHFETILVDYAHHTALTAGKSLGLRIPQAKHIHQRLRNRRMELLAIVVPGRDLHSIPFLIRRDLTDQPIHLIADVARRAQIHDFRLI